MGDDDTGSWWREIRAGSESTLEKLYRDVPAAEEYDLVEREAHAEEAEDLEPEDLEPDDLEADDEPDDSDEPC